MTPDVRVENRGDHTAVRVETPHGTITAVVEAGLDLQTLDRDLQSAIAGVRHATRQVDRLRAVDAEPEDGPKYEVGVDLGEDPLRTDGGLPAWATRHGDGRGDPTIRCDGCGATADDLPVDHEDGCLYANDLVADGGVAPVGGDPLLDRFAAGDRVRLRYETRDGGDHECVGEVVATEAAASTWRRHSAIVLATGDERLRVMFGGAVYGPDGRPRGRHASLTEVGPDA